MEKVFQAEPLLKIIIFVVYENLYSVFGITVFMIKIWVFSNFFYKNN